MSFLAIYFIGFLIMVVIALVSLFSYGEIRLSDVVILPIAGMLSVFGIAVLLIVLLCQAIETAVDRYGNNRVLWRKD